MDHIKIFDTSSIIMLVKEIEKPEAFNILSKLGYKLEIPLSVYGEIKGQFNVVKKLVDSGTITILNQVHTGKFLELKNRYPRLGNGELEVLAYGSIYKENLSKGYHCVFDDGLPRNVAEEIGVKYTGSVGLLNYIYKSGHFTNDEIKCLNKKLDSCRVPSNLRLPF